MTISTACVALHNFLKKEESRAVPEHRRYIPAGLGDDPMENNGDWRNEPSPGGLLSGERLSTAAQERASKKMRDELCEYFVNEGAVEWQVSRVTV